MTFSSGRELANVVYLRQYILASELGTLTDYDKVEAWSVGREWVDSKPEGWSDPDVVTACVAAFEAFR